MGDIALDVRSGVSFLRKQPGIAKVILWGFSGGGPTTTFYQAVAENGPSYCRGTEKLIECGDDLAGLPPADGLILVDAHPGNSVNAIRSLNAAVTNDTAIVNENQAPGSIPIWIRSTRGMDTTRRIRPRIRSRSRNDILQRKPPG